MAKSDLDTGAQSSSNRDAHTSQDGERLPKLTAKEFTTYNRLAVQMDSFHNHFRQTWQELYTACEKNKRPASYSLRQFLGLGLHFCSSLETHHGIEEHHIFPILGKKMPAFQDEVQLLGQHKQIHAGLDKFQEYLRDCRSGERDFRLAEMKVLMDAFGTVLWQHLDDEVAQLGAENMRKYWSLKEMQDIFQWGI